MTVLCVCGGMWMSRLLMTVPMRLPSSLPSAVGLRCLVRRAASRSVATSLLCLCPTLSTLPLALSVICVCVCSSVCQRLGVQSLGADGCRAHVASSSILQRLPDASRRPAATAPPPRTHTNRATQTHPDSASTTSNSADDDGCVRPEPDRWSHSTGHRPICPHVKAGE